MRRLVAACSAVMVAAMLVAACGSSSNPEASGDTSTTTASGSSNGDADFSAMLDDLAKQKFKVTWTDADGMEHTDAQDGKGNTVSISGDTQVFQTPTSTVTCTQSDEAWKCTQTSLTVGSSSGYAAVSAAEKTYVTALANRFGNTSSKTIAERDADCFTITAGDFGVASAIASAAGGSLKGAATYCNDHETGAVLENTITDENGETTSGLTVTKFEEPSASDFQPPATPTVVSVPNITAPGGVGAQ